MRLRGIQVVASIIALVLIGNMALAQKAPEKNMPPLITAAQNGDLPKVKALLAEEVNPDTTDENGTTPLMIAAGRGDIDIADALLDAGAELWAKNKDECTPLMNAAWEGKAEMVIALLKRAGVTVAMPEKKKNQEAVEAILEGVLSGKIPDQIKSEIKPALAEAILKQADELSESDPSAAVEKYQAALAVNPGLPPLDRATALGNLAITYKDAGKYKPALPLLEKALSIRKEILGVEAYLYAYSLQSLADLYSKTGEYSKALPLYLKARDITSRSPGKSSYEYAQATSGLANFYYLSAKYDQALSMFLEALKIMKTIKRNKGTEYATTICDLAGLYEQMGAYEKALPLYKEALKIRKEVLGVNSPTYGQSLNNIATLYRTMGAYDKALLYYQQAGEIVKENFGENHPNYATALNNLAGLYRAMGAYDKALPLYKQSLNIIKNVLGENHPNYGGALSNLGGLYQVMGEYDKALPLIQKAAEIFRKTIGENHPYYGITIQNIAALYKEKGEYKKALPLFDKASELLKKSLGANHPYYGRVLETKAQALAKMGKYEEALALYKKTGPIVERSGSPNWIAYSKLNLATDLVYLHRNDEAVSAFEEGFSYLEKARSQAGTTDLKKSFQQHNYVSYELAALFMLDHEYNEKAFQVVEASKARAFLDQLAEGLSKVEDGLNQEFKSQRNRLISKLADIGKRQSGAAAKNDEKALAAITKERMEAEAEMEKLELRIRTENPRYAAVRYPKPVSAQNLIKNTMKPDEVLIEYFLSEKDAWAFIATDKGFDAVKLEASSEKIKRTAWMFLTATTRPPLSDSGIDKAVLKTSASLYSMLIAPLSDKISDKAEIIIAPDSELAFVPFESLVVSYDEARNNAVFLLEEHPVKYIQSATVLALLRAQKNKKVAARAFLGFGDPVYNPEGADKGEATRSVDGQALTRLPETGIEVKNIADLFRKKSLPSRIFLRQDASEKNLEAAYVKEYGYLHFACHGFIDAQNQGLLLSRVPGSSSDGMLTIGEIMGLDWNARMAVLSACETGGGKVQKGEGVTGLTRAVMYAGSRAAVVSLWAVDDEAARELMIRFYKNLLSNRMDASEALRRAKLKMIHKKGVAAPFYWAPFVLYGE